MTDRYAVIGNPIAHSRSPWIHSHFAKQLGLDLDYGRQLAPLDDFVGTVRAMQEAGYKGANVTVPFKQQAFELGDVHSDAVAFAKAANTLKFLPDGQIQTDNTDGMGLCRDLSDRLATKSLSLAEVQVVMVGAGGAASGCVSAFKQAGVKHLSILNRTAGKAVELAQRATSIGLPAWGGGLVDFPGDFENIPVVLVNASSSSLKGEVPILDERWYSGTVMAYDMMYAAQPTAFMRDIGPRLSSDALLSDGLGMLVHQAALSFEWWTGERPDAVLTLNALRTILTGESK
ncbi:MAG TPA: shikimate dehydrogenase [Limnobacter sp.]|uniref:shikimate dehydrogenase n=1 Tax=Limnobacter sp. TaxID=2003368 RepID=UPI002E350FD9|nr:shikimate dehydrogenase [Limnobacter sp.]HEX5484562.1 shikimate dehydrogenase [Limnobacter sp.]